VLKQSVEQLYNQHLYQTLCFLPTMKFLIILDIYLWWTVLHRTGTCDVIIIITCHKMKKYINAAANIIIIIKLLKEDENMAEENEVRYRRIDD
jgi:hypothetical protein